MRLGFAAYQKHREEKKKSQAMQQGHVHQEGRQPFLRSDKSARRKDFCRRNECDRSLGRFIGLDDATI